MVLLWSRLQESNEAAHSPSLHSADEAIDWHPAQRDGESPALSQTSRTSIASQNPMPQTPARLLPNAERIVRIRSVPIEVDGEAAEYPKEEVEEIEEVGDASSARRPLLSRMPTTRPKSPTIQPNFESRASADGLPAQSQPTSSVPIEEFESQAPSAVSASVLPAHGQPRVLPRSRTCSPILRQAHASHADEEEKQTAVVLAADRRADTKEVWEEGGVLMSSRLLRIRLNVAGTMFETSLKTVVEGSKRGGFLFRAIVASLGKQAPPEDEQVLWWSSRIFRDRDQDDSRREVKAYFVDADPTPFPVWLEYLRCGGKAPFVEAGMQRERLVLASREAGLIGLAQDLSCQPDWLRAQLVPMLCKRLALNLRGQRLHGQDLSKLGFESCDLRFANLSSCDLSYCSFCNVDLTGASLRDSNLTGAALEGALLPAWSSGLMEGVQLVGATGWVPGDKNLSEARIPRAKLAGCDLTGLWISNADLEGADLSGANLSGSDLSGSNLRDTVLSGGNLSNCNLQNTDMSTANLKNADLSCANLQGCRLPAWDSGLMEGVKLVKATGWVPESRDLSNARLNGADLSGCDLSGVNLGGADLEGTRMHGTNLEGAVGGIPVAVDITSPDGLLNDLKVGAAVVHELEPTQSLYLRAISLQNMYDNYSCAKMMEILTAPRSSGPWSSLVLCRWDQTSREQVINPPAPLPVLRGFVKVTVLDTYGGPAYVQSIQLLGDYWGGSS